jgi:hypothetical protein
MMKRILMSVIATISLSSLFGLSVGAQAQAACTNTSLKGDFGFTCQGAFSGQPAAEIGIATYDGKGNVSGRSTISVNGTILKDVPFEGTYTLNADCTGVATFSDGSQNALVLDAHKSELRVLAIEPAGNVYTCIKKKQ